MKTREVYIPPTDWEDEGTFITGKSDDGYITVETEGGDGFEIHASQIGQLIEALLEVSTD